MRIVITHPFCWPYVRRGTERNIEGLARYLSEHGHEVVTVSTCPDGPRIETGMHGKRILHGPRWHPLLGKLRIQPTHTFFPSCWRSLTRLKPDVVHSFYFLDSLAASLLRDRIDYGTVLQMNGAPMPGAYHRRFPPDRWLIRKAIEHCGQRIVCSEFVRALVKRYYAVDSQAIVPGINLDEFKFGVGPMDGMPTLLALGNFDIRHKGVRVLVEAFVRVKEVCSACRLRLSGQMSDRVRKEIMSILPEPVRADVEVLGLGRSEDVPGLYQSASLVVVPSVSEPSGTVMMEAWASGTPVIAANHGGLPEFLAEDVGVLYDPGIVEGESRNAAGLAEAILKGLELASAEGTRDRCREYSQRFSWEVIGPRIEEVYRNAAGGGG